LCPGARVPLRADDASPWDGDARSAARLIAGSRVGRADAVLLRAGIEIRLAPGWHTYWRYPGDAGVPPKIDFAGSDNVAAVDVLWPAPQRLAEDGLTAIGYQRTFVLPLRVVPRDRSVPVVLRLKLDYAVCEKLCVPAQARGELALAGGGPGEDAALAAAESRVPKKRALGEGGTLVIRAVRREQGPAGPRAVVAAAAGPDRRRHGRSAAFRLRSRRRAAGRGLRGDRDHADRGEQPRGDRGRDPSRLIRGLSSMILSENR